jgi:predicted TIM-barrel enzyme
MLWTEQLFHIKKPIIAMLHPDALKMLYFINFINFINTESDRNPDTRPLSEIACSAIFNAHPDGLCISADAAGQDVDDALIASVKQAAPEVAVLCNTGCRPDTIARKLP